MSSERYPETQESPKWRNNYCHGFENNNKYDPVEEIKITGVPDYDPVYGKDGPLVQLWRKASAGENLWICTAML